jgi:MFS family permease
LFEAFQERDYRRFWTTQFISNIGSWMQAVAQGWLVYKLTDSPFVLGFVGFAASAPAVLLMLPGGVLADHFDRKRVVAVSQLAQAGSALFVAVAVLTGRAAVWHIVAAALVVGVAQSFSAPAFQAMIIDLLEDRSRLPNAIAMNSLQFNSSRVIGPLIAGVTLAAWGPFWCFFINAVSFLPLTWVLFRIPDRQARSEAANGMAQRLAEGFRFVRQDRLVLLLLIVVGLASLFAYPLINLMPVLARSTFSNDAAGLGYLMAAVGLGTLAGALTLSMRTPRAERAPLLIAVSLLVNGLALSLLGVFEKRALVIPLLVICGVAMVVCMALCNTAVQARVPDALRGRILSMYTFSFFAAIPLGNLAAGWVAERRGLMISLLLLGTGLTVSAIGCAAALATLVSRERTGSLPSTSAGR